MNYLKFKKVFIIAACLSFTFASCKKESNTKKALTTEQKNNSIILGFSQIGAESAWRKRHTESIKEAAAKNDIQLLFEDAQQKQENQLKALRSFIVFNVDVIAFVPIVEDGWDNVLEEAKEAGIPVIVVDRKIKTKKDNLYNCFIGENGIEDGLKAASFLLENFNNQDKKLNIVEFRGTENSSIAMERYIGFRQGLENNKNFTIINSFQGDFLRSLGKEICNGFTFKADGLYTDNKRIDIIFSHNDGMSLGIIDSLNEHNYPLQNYPAIISIDGEEKAITALKNNRIQCVVECDPNMGEQLMEIVKNISANKVVPKETFIHGKVFVNNSDLEKLPPRGY